jgi:hypothetical protein
MPRNEELDLVTLTVTIHEARMLQTACVNQSLRLHDQNPASLLAPRYGQLATKVYEQVPS